MENSRLQLWTTQWTIAFPQWSMQATMHVMQLCKLISYVHQSEYEGEQGHARVEKKRGWGIFNLLFFYVFFFWVSKLKWVEFLIPARETQQGSERQQIQPFQSVGPSPSPHPPIPIPIPSLPLIPHFKWPCPD